MHKKLINYIVKKINKHVTVIMCMHELHYSYKHIHVYVCAQYNYYASVQDLLVHVIWIGTDWRDCSIITAISLSLVITSQLWALTG